MKKSLFATMIFAFTACLPSFATTTITTPPVIAKTKLIKEKTIELRLANLEKKYTYVSITDMKGKLVYFSEGVKNHNGFLKAINIKNLVNGNYLIKVKSKGEELKQIFQIKGEHVYFSNFKAES